MSELSHAFWQQKLMYLNYNITMYDNNSYEMYSIIVIKHFVYIISSS